MVERARVLVCDGESQSVRALRMVLCGAGFDVDATSSAEQGLARAAQRVPDAAIIELLLPDGSGVDLCRRLREWSAMPLIVLSPLGDESEKVHALQAGADDFVTKPFAPRELVARLEAKLRRAGCGTDQPHLEFDGLEIDLAARLVRRGGDEVRLTPIEFKLLRVLVHNRGRLLTHHALLQHVWGPAYVDDRPTLRSHIAKLRRKIESREGLSVIRTDHRVGYRFVGSMRARRVSPGRHSVSFGSPSRDRSS